MPQDKTNRHGLEVKGNRAALDDDYLRKKRHHEVGIREAMALFSAAADPVARQHTITDLEDEGWTEADRLPRDEQDYVKMGLF